MEHLININTKKKLNKYVLRLTQQSVYFIAILEGEHKNTLWFQVVIKSKLTGIFFRKMVATVA